MSGFDSLVRQPNEVKDDNGGRTVKHDGVGAAMTSKVDAKGRVLRQDAVLGTDVIIWQHGTRIRTGEVKPGTVDPMTAKFDDGPNRARLERVRTSIEKYRGKDKFLQHLVRVIQLHAGLTLGSADVVTESISNKLRRKRAERAARRGQYVDDDDDNKKWLIIGGIAAVIIGALIFYFVRR